jgi:hypothetical protein
MQPAQNQTEPASVRNAAKLDTPAPAAAPAEPKLETPKTSPAHEIKLEVAGADSRVEIRLSERAGDVQVAVRTTDTNLADSLRDNLPALSSRLADSGLKTDTWHPSSTAGEVLRHTTESAAGNASQDADPQSRQQAGEQQSGDGRQRPKGSQQTPSQKEKGNDFAWLMSTIR